MRPHALIAALVLGVGACEGDGTTPPATGGPLIPGTWYMHEADSTALPAVIATRRVGVAEEKTRLDSARLTIRFDRTYEQRYWTTVLVSEIVDRYETVVDLGTFEPNGGAYDLLSSIRVRSFVLSVPTTGEIITSEQMVFFAEDPPITEGKYRLTRP